MFFFAPLQEAFGSYEAALALPILSCVLSLVSYGLFTCVYDQGDTCLDENRDICSCKTCADKNKPCHKLTSIEGIEQVFPHPIEMASVDESDSESDSQRSQSSLENGDDDDDEEGAYAIDLAESKEIIVALKPEPTQQTDIEKRRMQELKKQQQQNRHFQQLAGTINLYFCR